MAGPVVDQASALLSSLSSNLSKFYPDTRSPYTTPLASLGAVTTGYLTLRLLSFLRTYLRPSSLPKYQHGKPYSTWAFVTGASDGIGLGFAEALLSRGFNVLLHGRNPDKLSGVQKRLSAQFPSAQIRTVIADASTPDVDIPAVASAATTLPGPLTLLVNNVGGIPTDRPFQIYHEAEPEYVDKIINLNLRFPAQLTRALLSTLQKNAPAAVLNVGSGTSISPIPFLSTYCGSKAFNLAWSDSLRTEMQALGKDVEVVGLLISAVQSGGNNVPVDPFTPSSLVMAHAGLDRLGGGRGKVWGWWRHRVQWAMLELVPDRVLRGLMTKMILMRRDEEEAKAKKDGGEVKQAPAS